MIGKTFGRLTVAELLPERNKHKQKQYVCLCACGNTTITLGTRLRTGHTRSCGCIHSEGLRKTHGMTGTSTHKAWLSMKGRCSESSSKSAHYFERGISYCDNWESFENFLSDMGEAPKGATLDRINNDIGYSKENCRWADRKDQARNRTTSKLNIDDAAAILTMKKYGVRDIDVAMSFGICEASVSHVVHKRNWSDASCMPV